MVHHALTLALLTLLLEPQVVADPAGHASHANSLVEVGVAAGHVLAVRRQVRAHEAHGAVHQPEANARAALVAHHAQQARGHGSGYAERPAMGLLITSSMRGRSDLRTNTHRNTPTRI